MSEYICIIVYAQETTRQNGQFTFFRRLIVFWLLLITKLFYDTNIFIEVKKHIVFDVPYYTCHKNWFDKLYFITYRLSFEKLQI